MATSRRRTCQRVMATLLLALALTATSVAAASSRTTCSCASPASVPLPGVSFDPTQGVWLGPTSFYAPSANITAAAAAAAQAAPAVVLAGQAVNASTAATLGWNAIVQGMCTTLPTAPPGGQCGAGIAICVAGFCCSQAGVCSASAVACDGTCQCPYSGPGSGCRGAYPLASPNPALLPIAPPGGVCSAYKAVCPAGQCCSQFGFCVPDSSLYCLDMSCKPGLSPTSKACLVRSNKVPMRRYTFVVAWRSYTPDGFTRPVITVNGGVMQAITADVGDRIVLRVTNKLQQPLSLHFHGMLQRGTNTMDGVPTLTQRPVQPGECFTYSFLAEVPGSYWWHSHYHTQYMDGLWGPLVIKDPSQPKFASDSVVAVSDWYHEVSTKLLSWYLSPASQGNEPVPFGALVNFKGQASLSASERLSTKAYSFISAKAASCDAPLTSMSRLRILNLGGFAVFNVSVDHHRLLVIAEDGVLVAPVEVDSLELNNGQRTDVLLCQRRSPPSKEPVWLRATMIDANFAEPSAHNATRAVVYFTPSPPHKLPTSTPSLEGPGLSPSQDGPDFVSPYSQRILGGISPPDATRNLTFTIEFFGASDEATQYAHFSNVSLSMEPAAPSLLERLSSNPEGLGPPSNAAPGGLGWHNVPLQIGEVVDLVVNNLDTGEHPLHMHGHWFWVMSAGATGDGNFDPDNTPLLPTLARDTVTVNAESYVVLRFVADSPGAWIYHCHIDWHMAAGLGLVFLEGLPAPS